MMIGTLPNGIVTLTPEDGMVLTNGETYSSGTVFLGKNASPSDWREVEPPDTEEATAEDYESALARFGV